MRISFPNFKNFPVFNSKIVKALNFGNFRFKNANMIFQNLIKSKEIENVQIVQFEKLRHKLVSQFWKSLSLLLTYFSYLCACPSRAHSRSRRPHPVRHRRVHCRIPLRLRHSYSAFCASLLRLLPARPANYWFSIGKYSIMTFPEIYLIVIHKRFEKLTRPLVSTRLQKWKYRRSEKSIQGWRLFS